MVFPQCEKAAYVPGSAVGGGGRRCPRLPRCCGEAEWDPGVPAMPCGTGTGPGPCVPQLPGAPSMSPVLQALRCCCRDRLAAGCRAVATRAGASQQHLGHRQTRVSHVPAQRGGGSRPGPGGLHPAAAPGTHGETPGHIRMGVRYARAFQPGPKIGCFKKCITLKLCK